MPVPTRLANDGWWLTERPAVDTLPPDVSHASYAHRRAYAFIMTPPLPAGFVPTATRPGGPAERSRVIRPLVLLWVVQNGLLVLSFVLRLDLHGQIDLLTGWRVATLVWMMLVVLGLLVIVARIALNGSNDLLSRADLITLTATLYVCSLINLAAIIIEYNASRGRGPNGKSVWIDMNYLRALGPQPLPAIDWATASRGFDPALVSRRGCLVEQHIKQTASRRSQGFRSWRQQRALDGKPKNMPTGWFDQPNCLRRAV